MSTSNEAWWLPADSIVTRVRHTGCHACYSAFYQRLHDRLLATLRTLFEGVAARGGGGMAGFEDILLLDATILRLWRGVVPPENQAAC